MRKKNNNIFYLTFCLHQNIYGQVIAHHHTATTYPIIPAIDLETTFESAVITGTGKFKRYLYLLCHTLYCNIEHTCILRTSFIQLCRFNLYQLVFICIEILFFKEISITFINTWLYRWCLLL